MYPQSLLELNVTSLVCEPGLVLLYFGLILKFTVMPDKLPALLRKGLVVRLTLVVVYMVTWGSNQSEGRKDNRFGLEQKKLMRCKKNCGGSAQIRAWVPKRRPRGFEAREKKVTTPDGLRMRSSALLVRRFCAAWICASWSSPL